MRVLKKFQILFLLALTACASVGLEEAKTYDQREAYALGTVTAIREAATSSLTLGDMDASEGRNVLSVTDDARRIIDSARFVYDAGNEPEASRQLNLAIALLQQLQNHLRGAQ